MCWKSTRNAAARTDSGRHALGPGWKRGSSPSTTLRRAAELRVPPRQRDQARRRPLRHAACALSTTSPKPRAWSPSGVRSCRRRLPGSGAGPARIVWYSATKTLGVFAAEAWVRLAKPAPRRASASIGNSAMLRLAVRARAGAIEPEPEQLPLARPAGNGVPASTMAAMRCWCWPSNLPITNCEAWMARWNWVANTGGRHDAEEAVQRSGVRTAATPHPGP